MSSLVFWGGKKQTFENVRTESSCQKSDGKKQTFENVMTKIKETLKSKVSLTSIFRRSLGQRKAKRFSPAAGIEKNRKIVLTYVKLYGQEKELSMLILLDLRNCLDKAKCASGEHLFALPTRAFLLSIPYRTRYMDIYGARRTLSRGLLLAGRNFGLEPFGAKKGKAFSPLFREKLK